MRTKTINDEETTNKVSEKNSSSHLDPRLQKSLARSQVSGTETFEIAEVTDKLISVIAKVKDLQTFLDLPGVHDGKRITAAPDKKGDIVTAKVSLSELEQIQKSPVIVTLSSTQPLKLMLRDTLQEIGIPPIHSPETNEGNGVIIGIIDRGCDFVHSNFRNSDGTTRLLSLMTQKVNFNDEHTEEVVYTAKQINAALQNPDPYRSLGYDPGYGSHGTHVMDIAAGNGLADMSPGVSPKADLIFVEPDYSDIKNGEMGYLGDSLNLLNAVKYIFDTARNSPCVINISLGTNGGPHDGTSLFEQGIDGLVMEKSNRAVVLAAGNAFDDNVHASGTVKEGSFTDLQWAILEGDTTANELELWYSGKEEFRVELLNGDNQSLFNIGLGEKADLPGFFATHIKGNNGDHQAMIFGAPSSFGNWTVRIHGLKVVDGTFHAWIERDDNNRAKQQLFNQSHFQTSVDNSYTLNSICCGQKSIAVGSYSAKNNSLAISNFSAAGPTRDCRHKPEISAPGQSVAAAHSRMKSEAKVSSGTSMAAPVITGVIALMLAEAAKRGIKLSIDEIRKLLFSTIRTNPPSSEGWDIQYGNGRVDALAAINAVKALRIDEPLPIQ